MQESHTAVIERNVRWQGEFATEPYEAAWASEAIYFVRALAVSELPAATMVRVQISPDGMHWCDEGTTFALPTTTAPNADLTFGRVQHFGGWLRLVGEVPAGAELTVLAYLVLKG